MSNEFGTIYIGVTNNLLRRVYEHRNELIEGFTKKYKLKKLIYFEQYGDILAALEREKQLKRWSRYKKIHLMKLMNPSLNDLSGGIL